MSFMKFIRDGEMGSEGSIPDIHVDADVPEVPREAEVSSRPPFAGVPIVIEEVGTSVAAEEVRTSGQEEREPDVQITGAVEGISAGTAAVDCGIASRLRRRRGSSPSLNPSKRRKGAKVSAAVSDQTNHEDYLSADELSPGKVKPEDMGQEEFVDLFSKVFKKHHSLCAIASRRLAEETVGMSAVREELSQKREECESLRNVVKELQSQADQVVEMSKQIDALKINILEGETAVKLLEGDLGDARARLAQCLSDLGEKEANLNVEKTIVAELTKKVQEGEEERAGLISEVIPYACRALLDSDELGKLIGSVISLNRDAARASLLNEFAAKGLVDLSTRRDYRPDAVNQVEKAVQDYKDADFPFIEKLSSDPKASYHDLLSIKPEKAPVRPSSSRATRSAPQVNPVVSQNR